MSPQSERPIPRWSALTIAGAALCACSSEVVIATWQCRPSTSYEPADLGSNDAGVQLVTPWKTSFEQGFCDYRENYGSCYRSQDASFKIVDGPAHTGKYAAAFSVHTDGSGEQARCHLDGEFPAQAYFGAWYYIPDKLTNTGNWNLIHFQGGSPSSLHNLWDISLINDSESGDLRLTVFCQVPKSSPPPMSEPPPVPIRSWFHIEMFLKRSADTSGEIQVFQDGQSIYHANGLITDDTTYGQWYVGNWANDLAPSESTLYVDDVSMTDSH
jgi:hypothetical protein